MATFYLNITNESKAPLNGVIIANGQYNTSPVNWPDQDTTGPGGGWNGTSDNSGVIASNVKYTCPGNWSGVLQAAGYDDYPYNYQSGSVSGDFSDTVQMVANATTGSNPQNQGGNPGAGNLQNQLSASGIGLTNNTGTDLSSAFGGILPAVTNPLTGGLVDIGLVAIAIIGIAIVILVVMFL